MAPPDNLTSEAKKTVKLTWDAVKTQLDMQYTETVKRLIQRQITNILTLNLNMIPNTLTLYPP